MVNVDGADANKPSEITKDNDTISQTSSKVVISEISTENASSRSTIDTSKKSLLKSAGSGSVEKLAEKILIKTDSDKPFRPSSPIPEKSVNEETEDQYNSMSMSYQEKKIETGGQEGSSKEKDEGKILKEEREKEKLQDTDTHPRSEDMEDNAQSHTIEKGETSKIIKEKDEEENKSSVTEKKPEVVPTQTTKLQGKSKATGRIIGGWI